MTSVGERAGCSLLMQACTAIGGSVDSCLPGDGTEKFGDQRIDFTRDTILGERGADLAAGGGEVDSVFEGDLVGDGLGVMASLGEGGVEGAGGVERWDGAGQEPVEVARAPLAARLPILNGSSEHLAVDDRRQVARFVRGFDGSPVERVFNDRIPVFQNCGCRLAPRRCIDHPQRRRRKLRDEATVIVDSSTKAQPIATPVRIP